MANTDDPDIGLDDTLMTALYPSLWEFIVEPAQAEEFQRLYGPERSVGATGGRSTMRSRALKPSKRQ